jgi:phosphatidate cytidylyltransferase
LRTYERLDRRTHIVLLQRVLSAVVLIPIVLGLAYMGGPGFAALVAVAALLAGYEFYHIMRNGGYQPSYLGGLVLLTLLLLDAYYPGHGIWRWGAAAVVALSMVWQMLQKDTKGFLVNWALMLAGALYVGGLFAHMVSLRNLPRGLEWLMLAFLATWTCDTVAYVAGTWWGRHPFFAHISPRKTWEGALGGVLVSVLVTTIAGRWMGLPSWQGLVLGALLALGATFGDLAESLIKRQVGVKDSSALIPGHGGMLDRIDSLLFVGTIMYYFILWVVR